jgi:AcrR family transcriptional regulator
MRQEGVTDATLADVAAEAGVSRQAVYLHFQNRAGLLTAMARRHDVSSGLIARLDALSALEPVAALKGTLEAWFDYVPQILPIARALEAASITGEEGGEAWHDRMRALHSTLGTCIQRVAKAGKLSPRWRPKEAADWVFSRVSISAWDSLRDLGWSTTKIKNRAVASILAEIVA